MADVGRRIGAARLRMLVGKPGLDGHSDGAAQVAVRARDAGFEVVYQGIRLSPEAIARAAAEEDVHVVGLSILSGGHALLVPDVLDRMRAHGVDPAKVPVVVGGIIPEVDAAKLREAGVAAVYTPRDFDLTQLMGEVAEPGTQRLTAFRVSAIPKSAVRPAESHDRRDPALIEPSRRSFVVRR